MLPRIKSISHESRFPGKSVEIRIEAEGTYFGQDASKIMRSPTSDGIIVNSVTVMDETHLTVNILLWENAEQWAPCFITVTTEGEIDPEGLYFSITKHYINAVNPATAKIGQTIEVNIYGVNTPWQSEISQAVFDPPDGITVNSTLVAENTHIIANISVSRDAPATQREVTVRTENLETSITWQLYMVFSVEKCFIHDEYRVNPSRVYRGGTHDIRITGVGTEFKQGQSYAVFSGSGITVNFTPVEDQAHAIANITIHPSAPLTSRDVNVITGNETHTPARYSLFILKLFMTPSQLQGLQYGFSGETLNVVMTGNGTNFKQGQSRAIFSPGTGISVNSTTILNETTAVANVRISDDA